jgi:uncharacterized membrane protein
MGIILLIGVLAVVYTTYNNNRRKSSERIPISSESSSLEIAAIRYANGDISRDEYERLKTDLGY